MGTTFYFDMKMDPIVTDDHEDDEFSYTTKHQLIPNEVKSKSALDALQLDEKEVDSEQK